MTHYYTRLPLMNKSLRQLLAFAFISLITACSTSHKLPFESFSLEPLTLKTLSKEIAQTENQEENTQISRFTATYSGIQEQSNFKGYARVAKDSLMMISMSGMIGGEVFRVLLSPEQSRSLNRMEETYSISDYESTDQIIPLPYELLQSVLSYNFTPLIDKHSSLDIEDKMYKIENKESKKNYTSLKVDGNYRVRHLFYKDFENNASVNVTYSTFIEVNNKLFPENIEVTINNKREVVILRLTVKRVETKDKLSFPFSINKHYTRLEI